MCRVDIWDRGIAIAMATAMLGPPHPNTLLCERVPEFEKLDRATRPLILDRVDAGGVCMVIMGFV